MCVGVYIDFDMTDVEISDNFIEGYTYHYVLADAINCSFHDNIIFASGNANDISLRISNANSIDNEIIDNLFINKEPSIGNILVNTALVRTETISGNRYYSPFKTVGDEILFNIVATQLTLAEWIADDSRTDWNRDTESEITPSLYDGSAKPTLNFLIFLTNPAKTVRVVTEAELPYNDYVDMDGVAQTYPFNIDPYGSKVLVRPN